MANKKRLIDANAIKYTIHRGGGGRDYPENIVTEDEIAKLPTVDAVEVVHGQWEKSPHLYGYVRCSVCNDCNVWGEWVDGKKWGYCPNCGARMDLEG